ncbi:MAG: helix-turn-helix domain-containing protein [Steroidobacteraceae bacterium]
MKDDRIADLARRLAVWCEDVGNPIDAAGRVGERAAAGLLGRSIGTLKNWRSRGGGPAFYRGSPIRYALLDLAQYLEGQRTNIHEPSRIGIAVAGGARDRGRG